MWSQQTGKEGQALTEFAAVLAIFAVLFFGLIYLLELTLSGNRVEIGLHRTSLTEEIHSTSDSNPDPLRLRWQIRREGFEGRTWLSQTLAKITVSGTTEVPFAAQIRRFLHQERPTYIRSAERTRDAWPEHPLRYISWALAAADGLRRTYANGDTEGGNSSASSEDNPLSTIFGTSPESNSTIDSSGDSPFDTARYLDMLPVEALK